MKNTHASGSGRDRQPATPTAATSHSSGPLPITARKVAAGLDETPHSSTLWRAGVFGLFVVVSVLMVIVSAATRDADAAYITFLLCPLAAAALVLWGRRWQLALNLATLVAYLGGQQVAASSPGRAIYRTMGLGAALILAQLIATFRERDRQRLSNELHQLADAADFRETEIAAMTHDIRSPLATLVGLTGLLVDGGIDETERANLMMRLGSTTTSMDLIVKNMLDLFLLEQGHMQPYCREINPDVVVSEAVERYTAEAQLRGLKLEIELCGIQQAYLDPLHLERIVGNLITSALRRTEAGEVHLQSAGDNRWMTLEVRDTGPSLSPMEVERACERPDLSENGMRSAALGRYIARLLTEADGGEIEARSGESCGLVIIARLPISAPSA